MTTKHDKREEYSSNVIRVLHPARPISPNPAVAKLDNNLDYLLEDLQSSITPNTSYSHTSRNVQYLSPQNTSTTLRERSVSPGSEERKVYKTSSYKYSTTTNDGLYQDQNVNQLDALLQDLKTERDVTREKDYSHISSSSVTPGLLDDGHNITKTSHVYKSQTTKPSFQRELVYDATDGDYGQGRSQKSSSNYMRSVQTKAVSDISYDPTKVYDVDIKDQRVVSVPAKTITLDTSTLPEELKGVTLSDDILPVPGTKVTTTVRTYTYEIPSDATTATSKTLLYNNESYNTSDTAYSPDRSLPPNVVYNTQSYNTIDRREGVPPPTQTTKTIIQKRDVRETNTNVYPPENTYPTHRSPPPGNTTIIYKQDVTNTSNTNIIPGEPDWDSRYPTKHEPAPQPIQLAPQPGPKTTYYYKHESSNTTNTLHGPPTGGPPYPPTGGSPYPSTGGSPYPPTGGSPYPPAGGSPYPPTGGSPYPPTGGSPYPPHDRVVYVQNTPGPRPHPGEPDKPSVVTYKYSSHTTKSSSTGSPNEREPLLPAPFPTDGVDHSRPGEQPPKRLDDLMATFNGTGPVPNDESVSRRKEIDTSVATAGEAKIPSRNVAGPPVYYPPGHEMFVRKEEGGAAYRAQGGYAKASGKYEYAAESSSKSKTRSGAAVVPVCLPLCCAMPCSIM